MSNINQRLNGLDVFAYMGTNAAQPTDFRTQAFDPTINDSKNFYLGTWWLNTTTLALWYLAALSGGVATWERVTLSGIETLTGNSGGAVSANGAGNINVVGDGTTITIVGNPGTNTLTASFIGSAGTNSFPTDSGTATPVLGVLNVLGGTSARDINTSGSGNTIHVDLNNAITLGDLSNITGSAALTLTTGDSTITAGNINLTNTNTAGTIGEIKYSGTTFIHNYGTDNTFVGGGSGNTSLTTASATGNTVVGSGSGVSLITARTSTFVGNVAGASTTDGIDNVAIGSFSLNSFTTGPASAGANTAVGTSSLQLLTTGIQNTAIGDSVGAALLTGNYNLLLGNGTTGGGINYTGAESSNVLIADQGVTGESNVIRIGTTGSGIGQQNKCWVAGIRGVTTTVNDAVAVLIDSTGQLGTVSSSQRFKENIEDMGSYSDDIMDLRPVTFNYKEHSISDRSVGFIAEEVELVAPDLVIYDEKGLPQTVKYHDITPMLVNELQKLHRIVMHQENVIDEIMQRVEALESK